MMDEEIEFSSGRGLGTLPVWKKTLLVIATLMVFLGGVLHLAWKGAGPTPDIAVMRDDPTPEKNSEGNAGNAGGEARVDGNDLLPLDSPRAESDAEAASADKHDASDWAPLFLKGGLGFFVGCCLGHFLRAFLKLSFVFLGFLLLVMFALQYASIIDIDWERISGGFDWAAATFSEETEQFWAFVQGKLPSAVAATLGMVTGFKKN